MKFYIWGAILFVSGVLMLIGVAMSLPTAEDNTHANGTMPKAIAGRRGTGSTTNAADTQGGRPTQNQLIQQQQQQQNQRASTMVQPILPPPPPPAAPPTVPPMPDLTPPSPTAGTMPGGSGRAITR